MKYNFSAGPAHLAPEVIKEAANGILDINGSGLSLLEISHRSKDFMSIMDEAVALTKELLNVPDTHEVLFLTGGASTQFAMIPYNLLPEGGTAVYVNTGAWAKKAIKEAKRFGNINVVASSEDKNFNYFPKGYTIPSDASYFHITSNNTIFGTQVHDFPESPIPVVCDMSSDILSRPIDVSKFDIIYAGAQKNLGPAGTTLVIIKKDAAARSGRDIPTMLNYQTHIDKGSMFNTPPVYAIYVSMLAMRWLKKSGGVESIQKRNEEKAKMLYNEIDSNPLFTGTTAVEDRSLMNVTFLLTKPELADEFLKAATEAGISGIKGHRDVGGFRASIYNAMEVEGIEKLISVMKEFSLKTA
ncbi:MAG: 3-phosphoserine/phosphohydroxythreonine transaminase [Bacteroidia bacterium]|nr:3-phosphoserine/phosphohydroxythreonine transaminase [Bacteroidia bacterium]